MTFLLVVIAVLLGIIAIAIIYGPDKAANLISKFGKVAKVLFLVALGLIGIAVLYAALDSLSHERWVRIGNGVAAVFSVYMLFGFVLYLRTTVIGRILTAVGSKLGVKWRSDSWKDWLVSIALGVAIGLPLIGLFVYFGVK